ncbi:hypothetical protein [Chthonobacter rhizosphaerae]|uniref:hypothetical protein n=1 Tax=Chthonobacter rhizosphaerae TaxID=2735553 RepID=UPI0015EFA562|nr:hypothetical protein [Chthonobacter rhizosphaerae]
MAESNQQGTMGQALRKDMEHDKELDTVKGQKPAGKSGGGQGSGADNAGGSKSDQSRSG